MKLLFNNKVFKNINKIDTYQVYQAEKYEQYLREKHPESLNICGPTVIKNKLLEPVKYFKEKRNTDPNNRYKNDDSLKKIKAKKSYCRTYLSNKEEQELVSPYKIYKNYTKRILIGSETIFHSNDRSK